MKKYKFQILIAVAVLMLTTLACGGSFSTAKITDAYMSNGSDKTTTFDQDETFYAIVELQNAPEDTTLKAVWIAVDVPDVEPDFVIDEASITANEDDTFTFDLSNDSLWPTGDFKVDIYMNDKLERTLEFRVR